MGTSFQTHQDGPFPTIQKRNHHHQHMPDRMSEDMPDKLSFPHLHGSEMVYHILKPEIFTTNAMGTSFQTHQDGTFPTIQKRNHHHQHMPDRMSEDMPDKLSFPHLHGSEMVYHILKPEIFTTNAMGTSFQTHQDGPFPTIQKRSHHHQHIRKNVRRYAR